MRYPSYRNYECATLPSLREIPAHWSIIPLKYAMDNLDHLREPISADQRPRSNPQYDYYGASGVIDKIDDYNVDDTVLLIGEDGANLIMRNLPLVYRASGKFWVNNHAHILKPKADDYSYMAYQLEAMDYYLFITGAAQPKLSQENLRKVRLLRPPIDEQKRIATFLDEKCGKVDRLVAAKEKEVALLKELRERVIADAVTGASKTLSSGSGSKAKQAKFKPSGIPWLPEVPEGWEVRRLKNLFKLRNESYSSDEKLQVLSLLKDVGVIPYEEKGNIGNKSKEDYSTYNVARKGDIVMNSMNVIIGSVDISDYDGYISPAYYAITARDGVDAKYYNYIFHLRAVQKHMRTLAKGILEIRLRISTTALFGMAFPLPPLAEQKAIVAYIEAKAAKIDAAVAGLEREIAALKEYRERLIADVVTGVSKTPSLGNDGGETLSFSREGD